jgi:hypothetical protein
VGDENYNRHARIAPLLRFWNTGLIRFFSKIPTYFGSFTFLAIQYETRWAALLPTATHAQTERGSRGAFIAFSS